MAKKKPTSSYWEKRFELLQNEALRPADEYLLDLGEIYERTAQEIEQKMLYWTKRFADNNDLSMAEAKKILEAGELKEFHWTLEEYAKKAAKGSTWAKEVENASARVHLSRLEAMRLDLKGVVESAVPEDLRWLFEEVYERAYYGAGHEIARGFGTNFPMQKIDDKALDRVLRKPWTTDARTFSDRLWENKAKLIAELQDTLARGLILGTSQDKLIREMRDKMGTSYANARRIVRTESAFFSAAGDRDAYDSLGVKKFQILATLDTRTSEICQEMDQKVFDFKDYEIGITAPPFHPNCRSTTVPYFDDMAEIEVRAARDAKGNTVMVRGDMGYDEWKEWVDGGSDRDPFEDITDEFTHSKRHKGQKVERLPISMYPDMGFDESYRLAFDHDAIEKNVAQWLSDEIGGKFYLCPRVQIPKRVRSPDYLWDGEWWDLKSVYSHGRNTVTTSIGNARGQSENVILNLVDSSYEDSDVYIEMSRVFNSGRYAYIKRILVVEDYRVRFVFKRK